MLRKAKCGCLTTATRHLIVDIDYKNLEMYIAWHYSKDDALGEALTGFLPDGRPRDFHTQTASAIFNTPYHQVTGLQRFNSKFVSFGLVFGRSAWSLAQGELYELTGGDVDQAQGYVDDFWNLYSSYKRTYDHWKYTALTTGELRTPLGRVRRWRLVTKENRKHIENQAVNFPIQSLASDTCLSALIRLTALLPQLGLGHVLFTVHDSLVFEIAEDRLHEAIKIIVREMTFLPFETHISLKVDIEVGRSLGQVEPYLLPV